MPAAHVQSAGAFDTSVLSTETLRVTLGTTTSGNMLVVSVGTYVGAGGHPTFTVTDEFGNSWTSAVREPDLPAEGTLETFYAVNITGGATHFIDIQPSATCSMTAIASELSGVATSSPVTGTPNSGSAASGPATSGNTTTTDADAILYSAGYDEATQTNFTPEAGWTEQSEVDNTSGETLSVATRVVAATGTYSHTWGGKADADNWRANIVGFKAAAGGGGAATYPGADGCGVF